MHHVCVKVIKTTQNMCRKEMENDVQFQIAKNSIRA